MIEKNNRDEFAIIRDFFSKQRVHRQDTVLGIGDDAALVEVPVGQSLVITTDTFIAGTHFLEDTAPEDIGYKALAVNLSDLAAMGAMPHWFTLALTLPEADDVWLERFCKGLFDLSQIHQTQLIGGDLTRGALSVTIQALGCVEKGKALRRDGAKIDDLIYVTETLGDAALALRFLKKEIAIPRGFQETVIARLDRPVPQLDIGRKLIGIAHAAIDISDGLVADLQHILDSSGVGADINVDSIPLSEGMRCSVPFEEGLLFAMTGGDDYELCFMVPADKVGLLDFDCTCIGKIVEDTGLHLFDGRGGGYHLKKNKGYLHF